MCTPILKKMVPTIPGWYWFMPDNTKQNRMWIEDSIPIIVEIRLYAGNLSIGNTSLKGWDEKQNGFWSDQLPMPVYGHLLI